MRLIDADSLKDHVVAAVLDANQEQEYRASALLRAIDSISTAYDVDKVVEQLERNSQDIALIYPTDQGYDYENAIGIDINKAKEIVKSGGIE